MLQSNNFATHKTIKSGEFWFKEKFTTKKPWTKILNIGNAKVLIFALFKLSVLYGFHNIESESEVKLRNVGCAWMRHLLLNFCDPFWKLIFYKKWFCAIVIFWLSQLQNFVQQNQNLGSPRFAIIRTRVNGPGWK